MTRKYRSRRKTSAKRRRNSRKSNRRIGRMHGGGNFQVIGSEYDSSVLNLDRRISSRLNKLINTPPIQFGGGYTKAFLRNFIS